MHTHAAYLSLYLLLRPSENKLTINNFNYFMKMSNYTRPRQKKARLFGKFFVGFFSILAWVHESA